MTTTKILNKKEIKREREREKKMIFYFENITNNSSYCKEKKNSFIFHSFVFLLYIFIFFLSLMQLSFSLILFVSHQYLRVHIHTYILF